jgi:hypothetical protein
LKASSDKKKSEGRGKNYNIIRKLNFNGIKNQEEENENIKIVDV